MTSEREIGATGTSEGLGLAQGMVSLSPPSEKWAVWFAEEAAHLRSALADSGARIEHCGSTSIPGLPAKPILDILIGIPEPLDILLLRSALMPLGYEHATWAGVPGHEVFGKGDPRTHLVHVVPAGGPAWDRMLRFRDRLRGDSALAAEYAALKRDLAARYSQDRATYTAGKAALVSRVLA